jgi:hypothetical protein
MRILNNFVPETSLNLHSFIPTVEKTVRLCLCMEFATFALMWHHVDTQKLQISGFWVRDVQPVFSG